jgi:hypothetical protein
MHKLILDDVCTVKTADTSILALQVGELLVTMYERFKYVPGSCNGKSEDDS